MTSQDSFFEFAAEVGLTKHIGGIKSTEELLGLCQVSEGKYVLDVGCGAGVTPVFIAKKYGCEVVGIDISAGMIQRSKERARREGLMGQVDFRVADAQDLQFDDDMFDAVITESVTAFPEDKQKAVNEYVRVTKPGGYVGLNESTWLKTPPPPEMVAWVNQDLGGNPEPLSPEEWVGLLEAAGLREMVVKTYKVNVRDEAKGIFQRYGFGGIMGIYYRILKLYARNPAYRKFLKEIRQGGLVPENIEAYFGYGLYVGRK
jgi:ubiquinone/menaquinone biosynthesis C-methylase UbiE